MAGAYPHSYVPRNVSAPNASPSQERHHRTPVGEARLEQVHTDEEREPQEVHVDVDTQQHARGDEPACDQPEPTIDSHHDTTSTVAATGTATRSRRLAT